MTMDPRTLFDAGESMEIAANRPLLLDDPAAVWFVRNGSVDVFSTATSGGVLGARHPLFRAERGEVLFGVELASRGMALIAVATQGTLLTRLDVQTFTATVAKDPAARRLVDRWVTKLLAAVTESRASPHAETDPGEHGTPADLLEALQEFHRAAAHLLATSAARTGGLERDQIAQRTAFDERTRSSAAAALSSVLSALAPPVVDAADPPLVAASRLVAERLGTAIVAPPAHGERVILDVRAIARASGLRVRQVLLRDEWWRRDNGPLLGVVSEGRRPVALLRSRTGYEIADPQTGTRVPVDTSAAAALDPAAHVFYRPFPRGPLGAWQLVKFGARDTARDLATVLLLGLAMGVLGLLLPFATGVIFDSILPGAATSQLLQFAAALAIAAFVGAAFKVAQGISILRIEGRMDTSVQSALWDRLLNLPVPFFRRYSAGDLAWRAYGLNQIRETLSTVTVAPVLAAAFSILNVALLFYYDAPLAAVAVGLAASSLFVTGLAFRLQLRDRRGISEIQGRLSGMVLQFITGISKLRVAGAESRAFAAWAKQYSQQKHLAYRTGLITAVVTVFNSVFPVLSLAILFSWVIRNPQDNLSTGEFMAFYTAFALVAIALIQMNQALVASFDVVPAFERIRPILTTEPEVDVARTDPGELRGEVEVSHVTFRYRAGGMPVMSDVSLRAAPGEFLAIVGPSGSGKSTLFRLLLGFETPEAGTIFYDRQDLARLDLRSVRRQVGVVLQNGRLMQGDVFTNIVGTNLLSKEDAWAAAKVAALDEEIRRMPMGMFTWVGEGGGTLSGGQRQRLLVARAVVTRPRILLFDEATSALDNRTQASVMRSLEELRATRIVIAHRLSTVARADRIYVIDGAQIVQSGTYDQLMSAQGLFSSLVRRQLS